MPPTTSTPDRKKRRSFGDQPEFPTPFNKKRKYDEEPQSSQTIITDGIEELKTPAKTIKRRKSVAFTPETKKEDGDSSKTLIKAWESNQSDTPSMTEYVGN